MKRNMRSARVTIGVMVAALLVLGVAGNVIPALATHAEGSASVDVKETLSGQGVTSFTFTINHPVPTDPSVLPGDDPVIKPINSVLVQSPPGFVVEPSGHTAPHTGWTATVQKIGAVNRRVLFTLSSGNGIGATAATATQAFVLKTTVPTPTGEITSSPAGQWKVQVSSDAGANPREPTPSNLLTKVRVLKVMGVSLTAPNGVLDNSVTGAQGARAGEADDVLARCVVKNYASVAHTITATLSGGNFSVVKTPASLTIPSGGDGVFDFNLAFADVNSQVSGNAITCNATSVNDSGGQGSTPTGFNGQLGVTIQPRAKFTYVAGTNTFIPRAVRPGSSAVQFSAIVQKAPANSPAVTLDSGATELALLNKDGSGVVVAGPTDLASGASVPGGVAPVSLAFQAIDIPATLANGKYPAKLSIAGIDANDAIVEFVPMPDFNEFVRLDNLIPVVDTDLTPLAKPTGFIGAGFDDVRRGIKNGATLPFSGTVKDTGADSGELEPCGPPACTITGGVLHQYAGPNGTDEILPPLTVSPTLAANGNIGGSYTGSYAATARSVRLEVFVQDEAGNPASAYSGNTADDNRPWIPVDNKLPAMVSAEATRTTVGGVERRNEVTVFFDECVVHGSASTPRDWTVEGNVVQSVGTPECSANPDADTSQGRVKLTLLNDMADDGPYGNVQFDPGCPAVCSGANNRYRDRVSTLTTTPPLSATILDKIPPLAPTITAIKLGTRSFGLQDGAYWSNVDNPSFVLGNPTGQPNRALKAGYSAEIWQEMNGIDGLQRGSGAGFDAKLGDKVISATECPGSPGPGQDAPNCTTEVTVNFTNGDASDTSLSTDDHDIYAVSLDVATPRNVSIETPAVVEIDKLRPTIDFGATQYQADKVVVKFDDSVVRGQDNEFDWALANNQDVLVTIQDIQPGTSSAYRELDPGADYDASGVMLFGYLYAGPAGQRYEDRATNSMDDNAKCLFLRAGSEVCPA